VSAPSAGADGLRCDECHPRPRRAAWSFAGRDRDGRAYRAVVCDRHVGALDELIAERGGYGELVPLDGPIPGRPGSTGWTR
jgi:hypothetical protein